MISLVPVASPAISAAGKAAQHESLRYGKMLVLFDQDANGAYSKMLLGLFFLKCFLWLLERCQIFQQADR